MNTTKLYVSFEYGDITDQKGNYITINGEVVEKIVELSEGIHELFNIYDYTIDTISVTEDEPTHDSYVYTVIY